MLKIYCNISGVVIQYAKTMREMIMIKIRKYLEKDRADIQKICADTAKGAFAKKERLRKAICVPYVDYYMDKEPENVICAVDENDRTVGYIVVSTNPELFQREFRENYLKMTAKYSPFLAFFTRFCVRVNKKLDKKYGGGLHINIEEGHQGQKIGNRLLDALAEHLLNKNIRYMYLVTQNRKTRGYGFYMHYGFCEAEKYPFGSLALVYDIKKNKEKER